MVEPVTTITIVSLLAGFLGGAAQKAGEGTVDAAQLGLKQIYQRVKSRLQGDEYAVKTLERVEEEPLNELRQGALADVLEDIIRKDPAFESDLKDLVEEVVAASGDEIQITDSGAVAIGGNVVQLGERVAGRDQFNIGQ